MPHIVDIIELIEKLTIENHQFDVKQWCMEDADILIRAGEMIKRELEINDNKAFNLTKAEGQVK